MTTLLLRDAQPDIATVRVVCKSVARAANDNDDVDDADVDNDNDNNCTEFVFVNADDASA